MTRDQNNSKLLYSIVFLIIYQSNYCISSCDQYCKEIVAICLCYTSNKQAMNREVMESLLQTS